ncbi:MAG: hypothetical protein ACJAZO_001027 [Myxococcota bacterium]|jgi:hypothetical protein
MLFLSTTGSLTLDELSATPVPGLARKGCAEKSLESPLQRDAALTEPDIQSGFKRP